MFDIQMWFIDLSGSAVGDRQKGTRSMVMLTVWEIWKERNNRVFNRSDRSTGQVFNAIQEEAKIWVRAGNQDLQNVLPPAALVHTMHLG
jgi:uncharacterized protein with von Willebrand factor type A (vWA) domain